MALRNQEIGARLRELRGERPQTVIADELGVAQRTYQNWEAGDAKPAYRNLQRLAEYYGIGEEYILTGEGARVIDGQVVRQATVPDFFPEDTKIVERLDAIDARLAAIERALAAITKRDRTAKKETEDAIRRLLDAVDVANQALLSGTPQSEEVPGPRAT